MQTVVGIDPGLADTGYAVLGLDGDGPHGLRLVEAGLVRTNPGLPLERRLLELYQGVLEVLRQHRPLAMAAEDLYAHYEHPRTAILMGHARGVVLLAAAATGTPVHHFAPARIKKSLTGNGAAGKRQIQRTVQRLLGLSCLPEPDHVADALSAAVCYHFARVGVPAS
ncbi:MAG TPA: crossover junction endodeoxyribonuclease RuvC [Bacillota bacterium]